jgi:hypothetical protein
MFHHNDGVYPCAPERNWLTQISEWVLSWESRRDQLSQAACEQKIERALLQRDALTVRAKESAHPTGRRYS